MYPQEVPEVHQWDLTAVLGKDKQLIVLAK